MRHQTVNFRCRAIALMAVAVLGLGAAPPPGDGEAEDAVVRTLVAQDRLLTIVGERLAIAARDLCRDRGWASGVVVQSEAQYGRAYRAAATRVFGLADRPTVSVVIEGGPADRAGLRPGDVITAIDGVATEVLTSRQERGDVAGIERLVAMLDAALADGVAELTIRRDTATSRHALRPTAACKARFEVRAGSEVNASAGAEIVQVSSELIDPAAPQAALAPLVAHELAHVVLRHDAALRRYRGGLLPGFGRGGRALRASEIAADRLSVYLLARAGYPPGEAVTFWTGFGRRTDHGILSDRTHPGWRQRVEAVRVEVQRVARMQAAGEAIVPPDDLRVTPSG